LNHDDVRASLSKLAEEKINNVPDAAASYIRMGLRVTPLRGKDAFLPGWQNRQLSLEEVPRHFFSESNVGIVLGGAAGLVDVDLDNAVAIVVAKHRLPTTLTSGREKNLYSHHWYVSQPPPASKSYALPKAMAARLGLEAHGATLVELRSTGRQTVVPPSVHPEDGDRYIWHPGDICEIDREELARLVQDVAVATLLALHWPAKGSRQTFALHAAGYLGRHMNHERVEAIMEAAASAAEDEEKPKRLDAVRDTLTKLKEGGE
jgi:putative DNA primase/helicase